MNTCKDGDRSLKDESLLVSMKNIMTLTPLKDEDDVETFNKYNINILNDRKTRYILYLKTQI